MGNYIPFFENARRGRQARTFTTNVPKILDLKSSSNRYFFRKLTLGAPERLSVASVHQAFFFKFELFSSKVVSEEFFRRILKASPLTNSFFNIWRVARGEMCVQEAFHSFKMCLCIKDRFFLESCAFVYNRV